jgi:hypothetical protein
MIQQPDFPGSGQNGSPGFLLSRLVATLSSVSILYRPVGPGVGAGHAQELWVPADELEDFNRVIAGKIELIAEFHA